MYSDRVGALRIGLASPAQIREWSQGAVTKAATLHYRTQKPEPGGLFCQRIFGPIRDWSCACGRYRSARDVTGACPTCGVELAPATVRRERMGHIELAAPIVHPWYIPTIGLLLDLSKRQLAALLASQCDLVLAVDEQERSAYLDVPAGEATEWHRRLTAVQRGDLLLAEHAQTLAHLFPLACRTATGAEAIRSMLLALDLEALAEQIKSDQAPSGPGQKKASRRLQTVEAFRTSGQRPDWMVLSVLPVLPPELRPVLFLDGGRVASDDLNELYLRVLHRNHRLQRCVDLHAPQVLLRNERRLLQEACHALLDNGHRARPLLGSAHRPLKSLTQVLSGKRGRFRRHLLGKRVDYSGRSVIVAGPQLLLHECGLPKAMACELFKPFLMRKLVERSFARSPRQAKRLVERRNPVIWDLLAEVLFERVVLLNRAPTLHRLSILAFVPRLIEGNAIQLHPLVCSAFNADFDGDQMAVHVPLSEAAQQEARSLLLSTRNLRHPASGELVLFPSQDMVLGCFYLTQERPSRKESRAVFADEQEVILAHQMGLIDLHTPIRVRLTDQHLFSGSQPGERPERGRVQTTVGRVIFNEMLPAPLRYRNAPMTKDALKALVSECLATCGEEATVRLLDAIKRVGYQYATTSGISFAMSDVVEPDALPSMVAQGQERSQAIWSTYREGTCNEAERDQRIIELWTQVTEQISQKLLEVLDPFGTITTIINSGATKAKFQQIRQLSGIRGLLAAPSGRIIPVPVLGNYRKGLKTWEIFIAASGARKGFMDRSLNTAMSGYLTRRLVEAGMEVLVSQQDCQTKEGLLIREAPHRPMRPRVLSRILAAPAADLVAGTLLDERAVDHLMAQGVQSVLVRSPLTCQASYGVCQQCYGADLSTGQRVALGMAVGVLAGQAIGEPGTQLSMRTFHSGGIAQNASDITLGLPRVNDLFEARIPKHPSPLAEREGVVKRIETTARKTCVHIQSADGKHTWSYEVPLGRKVLVMQEQCIAVGTPLAAGPLNPHTLLALLGREAVQCALIEEVQHIYQATGALIHDKHLEVILRQMGRHVLITEQGDTDLVVGQVMDRFAFAARIAAIQAQGGDPARARPLLLGLTKTSLSTPSWIAAASFQETSRVLARAAIAHRQDSLRGLKERLVIGRKIPSAWAAR